MPNNLVLSQSVSRRLNLFREDDDSANNSWDCLFYFIMNLYTTYSYKIKAFDK
jgi:hypothetical protein